jgi:hypothetical protein
VARTRKGHKQIRVSHDPKVKVEPSTKMVLWCVFCDWRHTDSVVGRNRLGQHIANEHYDEIAYRQGVEPSDLEPV